MSSGATLASSSHVVATLCTGSAVQRGFRDLSSSLHQLEMDRQGSILTPSLLSMFQVDRIHALQDALKPGGRIRKEMPESDGQICLPKYFRLQETQISCQIKIASFLSWRVICWEEYDDHEFDEQRLTVPEKESDEAWQPDTKAHKASPQKWPGWLGDTEKHPQPNRRTMNFMS